MTMMIPVESIRNEPGGQLRRTLSVDIPPFHLRGDDMEVAEHSELTFDVYRLDDGWYLMGYGEAVVFTTCSRCLVDAELTVPVNFSVEIPDPRTGRRRPSETDEQGLRAEGIVPELRDDDQIDVTPRVREEIILAIPLKVTCRPGCRGLCPVCGTDLNRETCECDPVDVDPRLAKLEQLKESLREGGG